jgi:hypothetical protein
MRFRCLVVAMAFLAAIASDSWGQSKQPSPKAGQQNSAQQERGTDNSPIVVKVLPTEKTKDDLTREDAKDKEKTAIDQKLVSLTGDLALYTKLLFVATAVLALITLGLVVTGFLQIRDARETIEATKIAALAAQKSAETAETALLIQHRPIITIAELDFLKSDAALDKPHITWGMRNSGSGLAVVTDVVAKTGIVGDGLIKNSRAHNAWLGAIEQGETAGGLKTTTPTMQTRYDDIISGHLKLFLQIELQLMDVMHNRSSAQFPFVYNAEKSSFERSGPMIEDQEKENSSQS